MNIARVAVLGIAVGAGVLAAIIAVNMNRPAPPAVPAPVAQAPLETVRVLVAARDLAVGTSLTPAMLRWEEWPKAGISPRLVTQDKEPEALQDYAGALVRSTFHAGEPIADTKVVRQGSGYMSAILPEGKRAVATRIGAETSAGGFILPNDRVDVIMTRQGGGSAQGTPGGYVTETVLTNIRVLAIDQTIEEKNGESVVVGQTATLELTPQQVEILTAAQQVSDRMTLALRSLSDAERRPGVDGPDATHLVGGSKRSGTVTVVRGGIAREVSGVR